MTPELPDDRLRSAWRGQPLGGEEIDVNRTWLAVRTREAKIRRRDRIVYVSAVIITLAWSAAIWFRPDLRLTAAIGLAVALWLAVHVYRRSAARVTPESISLVCVEFHRAILQRERDFALAMPLSYLAPVALAQFAIVAALLTNPRFSESPSLPLAVVTFAGTAAVVLLTAWKRWRREAMDLQREIDGLPSADVAGRERR